MLVVIILLLLKIIHWPPWKKHSSDAPLADREQGTKPVVVTAVLPKKLTLFYWYAPEDVVLRKQLEKHLSPLTSSGQIESSQRLETADLVLILVSPNFIASPYCYSSQMNEAIQRHENRQAVAIPIIFQPCIWMIAPFASIQPLPSEGKPVSRWRHQDEALFDIAQAISSVVTRLLQKERRQTMIETT